MKKSYFPFPVRAIEFGLAKRVRPSRPASVWVIFYIQAKKLNKVPVRLVTYMYLVRKQGPPPSKLQRCFCRIFCCPANTLVLRYRIIVDIVMFSHALRQGNQQGKHQRPELAVCELVQKWSLIGADLKHSYLLYSGNL